MAPDLLFYPVLDEAETLAGMANREVVHPTAKDRVNQLHDPIHWLRLVAAEHVFELPQQGSSFLELWRVVGTPYAPTAAHPAEIETQEAEAFASAEVYVSTFSSLISTCSSANSSRSRFSTAAISQSCRW